MDPHVSTNWDRCPSAKTTLSLIHSFATLSLSLSNSYEQGRTLELERERSEEGSGGGKEGEEEKHQHPRMDLINILNPIMVSSRD